MKAGDIVVCKFPNGRMVSAIAICLLLKIAGQRAVVRKLRGAGYNSKHWKWSIVRTIPLDDLCRLTTARERTVRHVIGGASGEKLTGNGAGELR